MMLHDSTYLKPIFYSSRARDLDLCLDCHDKMSESARKYFTSSPIEITPIYEWRDRGAQEIKCDICQVKSCAPMERIESDDTYCTDMLSEKSYASEEPENGNKIETSIFTRIMNTILGKKKNVK